MNTANVIGVHQIRHANTYIESLESIQSIINHFREIRFLQMNIFFIIIIIFRFHLLHFIIFYLFMVVLCTRRNVVFTFHVGNFDFNCQTIPLLVIKHFSQLSY